MRITPDAPSLEQVLASVTFTEIVLGGDILTAVPFVLIPGQSYSVEFEYLGLAKPGSVAGDFGGFAGITEDLPGKHLWYMGTRTLLGSTPDALIDDGVWRTYRYDFTPPLVPQFFGPGTFVPQHLMFEDTSLSGGVPGDVFIDNVRLFDTPEPSYTWPCLLAATALLWRRRKKASDEQA